MSRYRRDELDAVPNHDGRPRARADRFFGLPDEDDVGELVSASTSFVEPARWRPIVLDLVLPPLVGVLVIAFVTGAGPHPPPPVAYVAGGVIALLLRLSLAATLRCSYVGTDGARHAWKLLRLWSIERGVRFADAASCELTLTRVFGRGYLGTNVRAVWRDARSRVLYVIDAGFPEYRIDREETDQAAIDRLPPGALARYAFAAVDEFRRYQRWAAQQDASAGATDAAGA